MLNITEVTSAAGEEAARQEEHLESLSIIIFFFIFMINKTRLRGNGEYEEDFVILFMWMLILGLKRARVTKNDILHGDLYCDFS